jgi:hypothetical protein
VVREGVLRRAGPAAAALLGLAFPLWPARAAGDVPAPPPATSPPGGAAAGSASAAIGGPSSCPRPDAVWAELTTLVPPDRLAARLQAVANGKTPVVEIVDLGIPYRILAAGQVREYRDESRDCAYRARIAAVFVALAIDPAQLPAQLVPPMAPPPPAPPPAAPPPPPRLVPRLDLGLTAVSGVGPDDRVGQLGAELRWAGGRQPLGPVAGVLALLPVDNTVGGVRLRHWRLPVDAGVRARIAGARIERYGEVGVAAALVSERALDLASPKSQTALELGVHLGVGLHGTGRWAPFAALAAELVPFPPSVFALPAGTLGHTPLVWIGATAGVSLGLVR